jgi:hypothetical protein
MNDKDVNPNIHITRSTYYRNMENTAGDEVRPEL